MELNDELMACYLDGDATQEELVEVRDYLCQNPEEFESIIALMDEDKDDYLGEWSEEEEIASLCDGDSFSDISLSAAAFAPNSIPLNSKETDIESISNKGDLAYSRLTKMLGELENLDEFLGEIDDNNI